VNFVILTCGFRVHHEFRYLAGLLLEKANVTKTKAFSILERYKEAQM